METWLKQLEGHTFRTTSFELTREELDTILLFNKASIRCSLVPTVITDKDRNVLRQVCLLYQVLILGGRKD